MPVFRVLQYKSCKILNIVVLMMLHVACRDNVDHIAVVVFIVQLYVFLHRFVILCCISSF